jgi:hypothetical protein
MRESHGLRSVARSSTRRRTRSVRTFAIPWCGRRAPFISRPSAGPPVRHRRRVAVAYRVDGSDAVAESGCHPRLSACELMFDRLSSSMWSGWTSCRCSTAPPPSTSRVVRVADRLLGPPPEAKSSKPSSRRTNPAARVRAVQAVFLEQARELGFKDESKGLFKEYASALRPDYFMPLDGTGIILEVERGKTTINNMDLLDFWKCHICASRRLPVPARPERASSERDDVAATGVRHRLEAARYLLRARTTTPTSEASACSATEPRSEQLPRRGCRWRGGRTHS